MIIRGKCISGMSEKKWDLAFRCESLDYIKWSKCSNMFIMMTKEEEKKWETDTIYEYYNNHTIKELEAIYASKKIEWENDRLK